MSREVTVSNRSVYHKYAEVTVTVPDHIDTEDIEQWLWLNEQGWGEKLDRKISNAEYEYGFGLDSKRNEAESESETRFDVLVNNKQVYGGHL